MNSPRCLSRDGEEWMRAFWKLYTLERMHTSFQHATSNKVQLQPWQQQYTSGKQKNAFSPHLFCCVLCQANFAPASKVQASRIVDENHTRDDMALKPDGIKSFKLSTEMLHSSKSTDLLRIGSAKASRLNCGNKLYTYSRLRVYAELQLLLDYYTPLLSLCHLLVN